MISKRFASMGFSICGLFFMVLILILYVSKRKYSKIENKGFSFLLTFTILLLLIEIGYVTCMDLSPNISKFTELLCRCYLVGVLTWVISLLYYIILLGTNDYELARKKMIRRRYFIILLVIGILTSVISFLLPIKYNTAINNIYSFGGLATYFVYIVGFVSGTIIFIFAMVKRFKFPESKKIPIRFSFILIIGLLIGQAFTGYDFNFSTCLFSFMVATLYFTIESQDSKLLSEVKKSQEEAEAANKAKTEFLENMSHEIRTPLNTILGFSESLLGEKKLTEALVKEDVGCINIASISLLDLINNILDISRLESGKEKLVEREYELQDLVFEISSIFSAKINNREVTFEMSVDSEIPRRYYGDYQKICKIIVNILTNALKYTNYGKITLEVLKSTKEEDKLGFQVVISNTGHAMKEELFNMTFDEFTKIGDRLDNSVDSTTLGFIVAKRLVNMLGGHIDFLNEPGKGTKYYIYYTQAIINEDKIGDIFANKNKDVPENRVLDLTGKKILIVDDNLVNIKLTSRLLEGYKATIDTAKSGNECIEKVKTTKYDLIFLDHMMPEMDGIATLNILKSSKYSIPPVIALTANSYSGIKEKYLEEGFNGYLAKPINYKDLNRLMHEYFDKD